MQRSSEPYSLIPVVMNATHKDLEGTIDFLLADIQACSDSFDRACADMLALAAHDPEDYRITGIYLEMMRSNLTGNVAWR